VLQSSVKLSWHQLCLLALISVKTDFHLNLGFLFVEFFTNLLTNLLFMCEEKCFIKFVLKVRDEVQNEFVKSFQPRNGLWAVVSSVVDLCKTEKTNLIERKTGAERLQTARSKQNYVTELICSQEGNTGSSKVQEKWETWQQYISALDCCEKLSWIHASGVLRSYSNIFV